MYELQRLSKELQIASEQVRKVIRFKPRFPFLNLILDSELLRLVPTCELTDCVDSCLAFPQHQLEEWEGLSLPGRNNSYRKTTIKGSEIKPQYKSCAECPVCRQTSQNKKELVFKLITERNNS